jgi:argininosuccinate synthase
VEATKESPYSVDLNLWGRSCEAGVLEDPWDEPPADAFAWTVDPAKAPDQPVYVEIEFEQGRPVGLDGRRLDGVPLIERLNTLGGAHGVGRIDHVENRLVGIKSRELYEAPAGVVLHDAHRELECLVLSKQAQRFKTFVAQEYADMIYNGLWFSAMDLFQYVVSNQRFVSGFVRVKLFKGKATVVGRKSEHSLYSKKLATYETADQFDHDAAKGFIKLWGLSQQTQARQQLLKGGKGFDLPSLMGPDRKGDK